MQENPSASSHALLEALKILAIPLAGAIGALLAKLFEWGKQKPEISAIQAGAEKTRAEARKLDGETINLAWDRISELTDINFELRRQLDLCEIRVRHHEAQEKRLKALIDIHEIKYSEFDEPNGKQ
jgi:hypothetical protein